MLSLATLYESPCVHTPPPQHGAGNLTVEGTGSPTACVSAIQGLFNFSSCEGRGHCTFDGVYQPLVQGQFYVSTVLSAPRVPASFWSPRGLMPGGGLGDSACCTLGSLDLGPRHRPNAGAPT